MRSEQEIWTFRAKFSSRLLELHSTWTDELFDDEQISERNLNFLFFRDFERQISRVWWKRHVRWSKLLFESPEHRFDTFLNKFYCFILLQIWAISWEPHCTSSEHHFAFFVEQFFAFSSFKIFEEFFSTFSVKFPAQLSKLHSNCSVERFEEVLVFAKNV